MRGPRHCFEMSLCETFKVSLGQPSAGSKQLMLPILLDDLLVPPSNRLEKLKGNLKGFFSIRINDQWRVIFKWVDGDAYEVRVVDYH